MRYIFLFYSLLLTLVMTALPNSPQRLMEAERLGLFLQPGQERELRSMIRKLADYAEARAIEFVVETEASTFPAEITATPAIVYQNENGRSIYPGKHLDLEAIQLFVDGNRLQIRPTVVDQRTEVLFNQQGRAATILSLKLTPWAGDEVAAFPAPKNWEQEVQQALMSQSSFNRLGTVALQPTDRRYYLDIHPYLAADGRRFLTYAVFSQFNCHEALFDNFDQPVNNLQMLVEAVESGLKNYWSVPDQGFNPKALVTTEAATSWTEIGWPLPAQSISPSPVATDATRVFLPTRLSTIRAVGFALPQVQFNFPAPIDRYAGTVDKLEGELLFSEDRRQFSGEFQVDMRSLSMGSSSLDDYVRKDALKTGRHRYANIRFSEVMIEEDWLEGQTKAVVFPAVLELMNQEVSVQLQAQLTPEYDAAGQLQLRVSTRTDIRIDEPFQLKGPDGPADIKYTVELRTQFLLSL